MATINKLMVGESLVGEGNEVAHIDLIIGPRGSAAETAFAHALTNNKDGFTSLLAVVAPNLPVKPNTILFNKVTIKDAKQAVQMFGPAQHAVAMAVADAVMLFRYSALTFNGHRIHYDRQYVTEIEGYPGLIVHGPLQATLLIEFAASIRGATPRIFSFRALNPLFDGQEFTLNAADGEGGLDFWIAGPDGRTTMAGKAEW